MNAHAAAFDRLPVCLAGLMDQPRWVGWRWVERKGKRTKPPFQASGQHAHNDKSETWATAAEILAAAHAQRFEGLGLQLLGLKGFAALDLDKVRDPARGTVLPWAEKAIRWGSYAELTPSGTGFRVLGRVEPDEPPLHRKFAHPGGGEVEFYVNTPTGRYITVTGHRVEGAPDALHSIGPLVAKLWAEVDAAGASQSFDFNEGSRSASTDFASLPQWLQDYIAHGGTGDRSSDFQAAVNALVTRVDFKTALHFFREHPAGPASKYLGRLESELRRSWGKGQASSRRRQAGSKGCAGADSLVTEDNAALRFVAAYEGRLRFCWDTGAWFTWNGHVWRQDQTGRAFHWARELARTLSRTETDRIRYVTSKTSFAAGVERFARSDPAFAVTMEAWDQDSFLLGTPEGTVDLRSGVLRPSDPAEGITKTTAVAPAATAECPLWSHFLVETTGGDSELIRFLQQWCGYNLTGDVREHALLFGYGPGGNGKSVMLNTVASILNDYAKTAAMETFVASPGDRHPTDLAMLRGARMVSASETEEGRAWAEVRIKALTGGDRITARFMRMDSFTYTPRFKLTIVGNHRPTLRNVDEAARRRFNIVPFVHRPANPDPQLEHKLRAEWPGILRWMIEGCLDWQRHGLVRPKSVTAATGDYFQSEDVFGQWLEDACDVRPGDHSWIGLNIELFGSWTAYAMRSGEPAGSQKAFAENLTRRGLERFRSFAGRGFRGIRLKPPSGREHDA